MDVLLLHIALGVVKVSLLLFYKRIFVTPWFQKTANVFMVVVGAWMLTASLVSRRSRTCRRILISTGKHILGLANRFVVELPWQSTTAALEAQGGLPDLSCGNGSNQYQSGCVHLVIANTCRPLTADEHFEEVLFTWHLQSGVFVSTWRLMELSLIFLSCVVSSAVRLYYTWQLHLVESGKVSPTQITSEPL